MPLPVREYDRNINSEIERLVFQSQVLEQEADGIVGGLSEAQFQWSPKNGVWSIGQNIEHLNLINQKLEATFNAEVKRGRAAGVLGDGPFVYGWFSRWVLRMVQPTSTMRTGTKPQFQPKGGKSMAEILGEWAKQHEQLREIIYAANGLDLAKLRVASPVNSFMKYALGAGFWIRLGHDRRHMAQARVVRNDPNFPKN